ncbi:YsnF/AvaK domain-containing protein [Phycisphaerales bacterium AB-hyl4]|uniref:YsnF/AvaK domain-containing protein n=1 Tax=Natronomicrosphaera hydrolytica TaxID=3242702 RepID=A0ABV4U7Y2_9BACT
MAINIIGLFDSADRARTVRDELLQAGFDRSEVTLSQQGGEAGRAAEEPSFWDQVKEMLGMEEASYYEEGSRRGGTIVSVNTSEDREQAAVDIIERHRPMDVDVEAERWRQEGWAGSPPSGQGQQQTGKHKQQSKEQGEQSVPLPEEELRVGKRRVTKGGVRVYTRVTEHPVQKDVELTDENVDVHRREVDKPAGKDAFRERTIEAEETREEPVVEKEARTREEIVLDKDKKKHTETVEDTVRRTEAEIEGGGVGEGASDQAYQFGKELANDTRYSGRAFETIEPEAREAFERRNIGDWSRDRDKVRQAYERSRAA